MANPKLKYLEDVPWDNSLKLSNGKTVHGLEQLPMVIKFSDDEVFANHVTDSKNDFANWIRDVIGYPELASQLLNIKTKDEFLKFMDNAINDIKHYVAPEPVPQPILQTVVQSIPQSVSIVQPVVQQPIIQSTTQSVVQTIIQQNPQPVIQSIPQSVVQPIQSILQSVEQPVQQVVSPLVSQQVSPPVPVSIIQSTPQVVPSSVSQSIPQSVIQPLIQPTVQPVQISQPVSVPETDVTIKPVETTPVEEIFEFEEIFKVLIGELEQEVLAWDSQTS